ncbi:MAG TPA: NAD(P)/FAD-dependent oxidoreductase, partial [Armatimonadetes bacterium]|nr:NAD(P)/FAD-dependent oxidoreductase [Armatimonadota bacterium]
GVSKANTGIVHSGYDDDPVKYPNRARFVVRGNRIWRVWAEQLHIPVNWCGSLVLARSEEDRRTLRELLARGVRNGVPELSIIDGEEARLLEPTVSDEVVEALWSPTAGVISPYKATAALAENCVDNGVRILTETTVRGVKVRNGAVTGVETDKGFIEAGWIVNAAGLHADEIARMAGAEDYSITPRRGEYLVFDRDACPKPSRILFPTPTPVSKGVVVETTVEGNLMIGPNAEDLPKDYKDEFSTTRDGLTYVWREASKLVKRLPGREDVIRFFSGLRPEPTGGDFIIRALDDPEGFVEAAGMRSPGLASAPAVALEVLALMRERGLSHGFKRRWRARRKPIRRALNLSWRRLERLISRDPSYGRVVCWCEGVTEGEIL